MHVMVQIEIWAFQQSATMAGNTPNPKPPPPLPPGDLANQPFLNPVWPPEMTAWQLASVMSPVIDGEYYFFSNPFIQQLVPNIGTAARLVGAQEVAGCMRLWFACGAAAFPPTLSGSHILYWCVDVKDVYVVR